MKKKVIICGFIIIIFLILFLIFSNKEKKIEQYINSYNNNLNNLFEILQSFPKLTMGEITGNLKYNGAHKEPYSTTVEYEFLKNEANLTINSPQGAINIIWNNELLQLIRKWNQMEKIENILIIDQINKNQITFQKEKLNKLWDTNIENFTFHINSNTNELTANINEYNISIKDNTISINNNENHYILTLGDNHYTFTQNDQLKIQLEKGENSNIYHVIMDKKTFLIEQNRNSIKVSSNNSIENFHSMELTFTQKEINSTNWEKSFIDLPILKYLEALDLPDWSIVK